MKLRRRTYMDEAPASKIRVFHGTGATNARKIKSQGLISKMGYDSPRWFMVTEDFDSAAFHSKSTDKNRVVVELVIPTEPKTMPDGRVRQMWDGYPYLWKPSNMDWDGPTRWWALRKPLKASFVKKIHPIKAGTHLENIQHRELPFGQQAQINLHATTIKVLEKSPDRKDNPRAYRAAIDAHKKAMEMFKALKPGKGLAKDIRAAKKAAKEAHILTRRLG